MSAVPGAARDVLEAGTLCYLAAPSRLGPHVTPVVFVLHRDRLWLTTSRGAVKSRVWRRDPVAGGLIRHGGRAVSFGGRVTLYDAFDPFTWPAILLRAPSAGIAWTRFGAKNARFFAGYARDAYRVPFSWSPPGRVLASIDLERGAVLDVDDGRLLERWGGAGEVSASRTAYRERRGGVRPELGAPDDVRSIVGRTGEGVAGIGGRDGPTVVPVRWARSEGAYFATVPEPFLTFADIRPDSPGALVVDRADAWRAARMRGLLLRGGLEVFVRKAVRSGRTSLETRLAKLQGSGIDTALLRLRPTTAVWWKGWSSGTVSRS